MRITRSHEKLSLTIPWLFLKMAPHSNGLANAILTGNTTCFKMNMQKSSKNNSKISDCIWSPTEIINVIKLVTASSIVCLYKSEIYVKEEYLEQICRPFLFFVYFLAFTKKNSTPEMVTWAGKMSYFQELWATVRNILKVCAWSIH